MALATDIKAGYELNKQIGEVVFGWKGIGFYGPPTDGKDWIHLNSVWYSTPEEANKAYKAYRDSRPLEWNGSNAPLHEAYPCYWEDGWGPLMLPEFGVNDSDWRKAVQSDTEDEEKISQAILVSQAWLVVEKMKTLGFSPVITYAWDTSDWNVSFEPINPANYRGMGWDASISLAICKAALKATRCLICPSS
jgi:hypothetical protein